MKHQGIFSVCENGHFEPESKNIPIYDLHVQN